MQRRKPLNTVRLTCTVVFLSFTFAWLYWFQADVMAFAQHGLSGGKTHYDRTIGAIICTAVLLLVHLLINTVVHVTRTTHALTYFPSFLLLAFVSSVSFPFSWGAWPWAAPLALLGWAGLLLMTKKMVPFDTYSSKHGGSNTPRLLWVNLLQMAVMMLGVALVSNTQALTHFKARAELALLEGNADEALRVGRKSYDTDATLTMLRVFALSKQGLLGDKLFSYAVAGSSKDMLPLKGSNGQLSLMPDSLLWEHFGLCPDSLFAHTDTLGRIYSEAEHYTTSQYLRLLQTDSMATSAWRDYLLTGWLIDRQLDSFAIHLPEHYVAIPDSLPRHYREALVLYNSQPRHDTLYHYVDTLMERRWYEYQRLDSIYNNVTERKLRSEEDFGNTYWYYY